MSRYKVQALQELADQQVRFAPPERRLEQLSRVEKLLNEIDPNKTYPYAFVCYRVTDFRPEGYADLAISGGDVIHDLGLFLASLAHSMPAIPAEEVAEPVLTLEEMSKKLNVTTKTINRWRKRGLIGVPILFNGRRHVGFLPSLVDPFLTANKNRVERGSRFSQLTEQEKEEILRRARRFARVGTGSLTEISRRIVRRLGRSPETVRYTIKNFDRAFPDRALFPDVTGTFDLDTKELIFNSFRKGTSVDTLAKRFQRTRSSMYRVINEIRAQRLLEQPVEYIDNVSFEDEAMAPVIEVEMPDLEAYEESRQRMRAPKDAPPELASLYEVPLLNKDQEQHLFRKMNYLKFKAGKLLDKLKLPSGKVNTSQLRTQDLDRVESLLAEANAIKDQLINCNMRLVVAIAKRHAGQGENFFELLSDGNMSLIRAVEKFDYSRGNKFSTYASWAIMKNFARSIPEEKHRRERYLTGNEEIFATAADMRSNEREMVATAEHASSSVHNLLEQLEPREREIIRMRAGLDSEAKKGLTLEKIGEKLGITKERVRQLNVRAMRKLRGLVEQQKSEL